jgi:hypothetical protein
MQYPTGLNFIRKSYQAMKLNVWFNSGVSITAIIRAIREREDQLLANEKIINKLFCTHKNAYFVGFGEADFAQAEPVFTGDEYVQWALEFAERHRIDRLVVGDHFKALTGAESRFNDIGVQLMYSCPTDKWDAIDDKSAFYATLKLNGEQRMLPAWGVWNDGGGDLDAVANRVFSEILSEHDETTPICVKPVRGIYGQGFFRLSTKPDAHQQLFYPDRRIIEKSQFNSLAIENGLKHGHGNWMVMEFLSGPEYSVDCLAWGGKLISAVAREKQGGNSGQVIVHDETLLEYCRSLANIFKLHGVFNAQFLRNKQRELKVLEINPRFSGGTGMSVCAGVNLPWWWLNLTTGAAEQDVPAPAIGTRVQASIIHITLRRHPALT